MQQLSRRMRAAAMLNDAQRLEAARGRAARRAIGALDAGFDAAVPRSASAEVLVKLLDAATPQTTDALIAAWVDGWRARGVEEERLRRELRDELLRRRLHPGHSAAAKAFMSEQEERHYRHQQALQRERSEPRPAGTQPPRDASDGAAERKAYLPDGVTSLAQTYWAELDTGTWRVPSAWAERR